VADSRLLSHIVHGYRHGRKDGVGVLGGELGSGDRWMPPNLVILSKSACLRTVKLNVTWEGKGLGRVRAMACGVAVVPKGDIIDSKVDSSQPPRELAFQCKIRFSFSKPYGTMSFAIASKCGAEFPHSRTLPRESGFNWSRNLKAQCG
jgi:hypothetical protein